MTVPAAPHGRPDLTGMRVAFALYYYRPYSSGLTIYVERLAARLIALGAQVEVIAGRHAAGLPSHEVIDGVAVRRVRVLRHVGKGMVMPGFVPAVVAASRHADVTIPVMPMLEAGLVATLVPARRLLPLYVCDLRLGGGRLDRLVERLSAASARHAVRRVPRFVALSREYAAASRVVGRWADRAVGVAPPVEPGRFAPADPSDLRRRLGLQDAEVVGFVGRLVAEKGVDRLIRAMRSVRRSRPGTVLVVAGEGERVAGGGLMDALRAESAGDPGVQFTGFLPDADLPAFYSMCRVLALPSVDPLEAFGMVQVEAMFCGCPVVVSDLPGVRRPVADTGMGRLVAPGDVDALARALVAVLEDRDAHVRPRETVVERLDPEPAYAAFARLIAGYGPAPGGR